MTDKKNDQKTGKDPKRSRIGQAPELGSVKKGFGETKVYGSNLQQGFASLLSKPGSTKPK